MFPGQVNSFLGMLMNGMTGQSYCLNSRGISSWSYPLLEFPYHPDKSSFVVAYSGEVISTCEGFYQSLALLKVYALLLN